VTVLITGGTGFIGAALAARLAGDGVPVRAIGRELGGLTGSTDWRGALAGCDRVVHLMARVHRTGDPRRGAARRYRTDNVDVTVNLARQAAASGVRRLVFMSSIKVNGEGRADGSPYRAGDPPDPRDDYATSKLEAERALAEIAADTGLEVVALRPPLVYGPGARANFAALVRLVAKGTPLPFASVRNRRSLIALPNLVDLVALCLSHPAAVGRTWLAADGSDWSTPELISQIAVALGRPARLVAMPPWLIETGLVAVGRRSLAQRLLGSLVIDAGETREALGWVPPASPARALAEAVRSRA
jgi:nucleoside-diphosphate-sugar epimerase